MESVEPALILVTGPSRSGKSEWAEWLAREAGKPVIYIATAQVNVDDPEWQARIAQHQARRPPNWETWAVPMELADAIAKAEPDQVIVVDALGTWLANLLEQDELTWKATLADLTDALGSRVCPVILVAEEVGWGVVPAYPLGRIFRDRLGELTRAIGVMATTVYLVTAGHVLNLSQLGQRLPMGINEE